MSNKYRANESLYDWCMVLLLEDYESLPAVDSKDEILNNIDGVSLRQHWLRKFQQKNTETGKWEWLENSDNEWAHIWAEIVEEKLECERMPESMKKALLNDIVNDYSCRDDYYNKNPTFMNEIKDLAEDDGLQLKEDDEEE
jgi:hypothetical protein